MRVNYIDYNAVTAQTGVFLTEATSITQPYEGMGNIFVLVQDGYVQDGYEVTDIAQINDTINDPLYGHAVAKKKDKIKNGEYKKASPSEAVYLASMKVKEMGANGIINLQIKTYLGEISAYVVTGMAIKTK